MGTGSGCPRCDALWHAYASATQQHVDAMKEQQLAGSADPRLQRMLDMRAEALGAERAAARVKITTHLVLSHSRHRRPGAVAVASQQA